MEQDLQHFVRILSASCERIEAEYFQLPQADGDSVYRERVYCYELYHQMRTIWERFPYSLGGEIDKSGHALFRGGPYAQAKPDFLVHMPGDMGQNLAVVEVKPATRSVADLHADINKLSWFCDDPASYYCGILLVFGLDQEFQRVRERVAAAIGALRAPRILLAQHLGVGRPAEIAATSIAVR
jgi:hypothetical protein